VTEFSTIGIQSKVLILSSCPFLIDPLLAMVTAPLVIKGGWHPSLVIKGSRSCPEGGGPHLLLLITMGALVTVTRESVTPARMVREVLL
jgi:hypothetical protein